MSCATNSLTLLGSDALNQAAGALNPAVWTTPIETGGAVVLNGTSAFGGGGTLSEAKYIGAVVPQDQYAEIQWKYSGILAPYVDLTFRRDPVSVGSMFLAAFAHGGTFSFLLDNNGTWESDFNLSSPLATGDKLRVVMIGTQVCVWRDTGSGYVLEHTDTLPAILPTGGSIAGQTGFTLSGQGLANNFATGSAAAGSPAGMVQLTGGAFQDSEGNPIANGNMTLRLSADQRVTAQGVQLSSGRLVTVPLDANGNVSGTVFMWPNSGMSDTTSFYFVRVYNAQGQLVWGPQKQQINSPSPFNCGTWVPNTANLAN